MAVEFLTATGSVHRTAELSAESGGYFSGLVPEARPGSLYRLKLDSGSFPDPASRFQPEGPHGPSQVIDPAFAWTDDNWRGLPAREWVLYELHLGTFTSEGTWAAAATHLPELARLGITMIEVMAVADFPGEFGWGYDGVNLFAPCRLYGTPDDARAFIDAAHGLGIAVILDVVYNHLGPDGNYLPKFAPHFFSTRYKNEWGDALNFDDEFSLPVREYFVTNARYWIDEFHFDGLRLDATQQIYDVSPVHLLAEISQAARAAAPGRELALIAENECQHSWLVRPLEAGGCGLDALWNDDFHHSAMVAATGRAEAYYSDYRGTAQEFISGVKRGFLYQGQWYRWQQQRRGRPALDLTPANFVSFLQNHDQVANSLRGLRFHQQTSPAKARALTALTLLSPQIPLLFQGQEFAASAPFLYFADHTPDLNSLVAKGRRQFLSQFPSAACEECADVFAPPGDRNTFLRCKLDWAERDTHRPVYDLHADLLRLRREEPAIAAPAGIDGAVLSERAFVLRYFATDGEDAILIVNLGMDLIYAPSPEPLLAPPEDRGWRIRWSSEAPQYGGGGTPPLETTSNWIIPGHAAVLLVPDEARELPPAKFSEKN